MQYIYIIGWYTLLIAVIGDLLVSAILSLFYKEYNSLTMSISALGYPQSPVRSLFNIWMFIEGICICYLKSKIIGRRYAICLRRLRTEKKSNKNM